MDATIKGKIEFLGKQVQMLANSSNDAVNYYNTIIKTQFDRHFWSKAGLSGGASALLLKASIPKVTISALTEMIATTSTELATTGATAVANPATYSVIADGGILVEGVSAGAATSSAASGTVAGGAALASGGSAISIALPWIAAGIAAAVVGKVSGEIIGRVYYAKKGKKLLEELSSNVTLLKTYCNIMKSQISIALDSLNSASILISDAEKEIANPRYRTKNENLKSIRERQAEVQSLINYLKATQTTVDIIYNNLSAVA